MVDLHHQVDLVFLAAATVKLISNASRVLDESREIVRDVRLVEYIEGFQVYGTWSMILEASTVLRSFEKERHAVCERPPPRVRASGGGGGS